MKIKLNEQLLLVIIIFISTFIIFFFVSFYHKIIPAINNSNTAKHNQLETWPLAKILSSGVLKFASEDFKLYYITPINNGLAMHYSPNELNYNITSELIINQYGDNLSAKDLANGITEQSKQNGSKLFQPFTAPDSQKRESYYITSRSVDEKGSEEAIATIYIIKVFEDNKSTYSLIFRQDLKASSTQEAEQISDQWMLDNLEQYGGYLNGLDISKSVEFYNKNKELKKELSKSNKYKSLKWENKVIKEQNNHADIDIEYPQFIGGAEVLKLNELVKSVVDKSLVEDRSMVKDWIEKGRQFTGDDGNDYYENMDCGYEFYSATCSVNLSIKYEINSIVNDIVSIKIITTDFTGGGNGNPDVLVVINYDLKNDQNIEVDKLFCKKDYISKLIPIAKANIRSQTQYNAPLEGLGKDSSDDFKNIGIGEFGITIYFQPYAVAGGSAGIVESFIPYSDLVDDICLPLNFVQQNLSDNFFPLKKGNYWQYQGSAKTLYNGEITTEKLTRNIKVIDTIESGDLKIVLLQGDFVYFTPDTYYNTIIEKNKNLFYYFEGRDLFDKLSKQIIDNINKQFNLEEINLGSVEFSEDITKDNIRLKDLEIEDSIFLKYPLVKDEKFGCYGIDAEKREDNLYCRYVLDKEIIKMGGTNKDQYQLVDGTNANETKLYFVPGIGVTKYQYKHNGVLDEATLDLVNYSLK